MLLFRIFLIGLNAADKRTRGKFRHTQITCKLAVNEWANISARATSLPTKISHKKKISLYLLDSYPGLCMSHRFNRCCCQSHKKKIKTKEKCHQNWLHFWTKKKFFTRFILHCCCYCWINKKKRINFFVIKFADDSKTINQPFKGFAFRMNFSKQQYTFFSHLRAHKYLKAQKRTDKPCLHVWFSFELFNIFSVFVYTLLCVRVCACSVRAL